MELTEAYFLLHAHFGNYQAVADYLGMTSQHLCALRNGRARMSPRTAEYILLKARELSDQPPLSPGDVGA